MKLQRPGIIKPILDIRKLRHQELYLFASKNLGIRAKTKSQNFWFPFQYSLPYVNSLCSLGSTSYVTVSPQLSLSDPLEFLSLMRPTYLLISVKAVISFHITGQQEMFPAAKFSDKCSSCDHYDIKVTG